jgi:DNA-binding IclR family transcriptional regulator
LKKTNIAGAEVPSRQGDGGRRMEKRPGTLEKAFMIFECFGDQNHGLSLEEISQRTGLSKTTVFRILNQLAHIGYISKVNNRHQISMKFLSLAKSAFHGKKDVRDVARTHMEELQRTYNESINFAVWDKGHAVLIGSQPSLHEFRIENKIGQVFPLHSTTIGKVIAAYLDWEMVREILIRDGMPGKTARTITDLDAFAGELARIREAGFAVDNEESFDGVRCIGVPIFRSGSVIFGGLSMAGPASRIHVDDIPRVAKDLQIAGYRISFELSSGNMDGL